MKILYIHQYFRTPEQGGAIRSYYLAKALVAAGHQVELITAYDGAKYRQENIEGIHVHYLPVPYQNAFGFARRVVAFMRFMLRSIYLAQRIKNLDLCYATSTPLTVGVVALYLKRFRQIPFYFEVRDLWPEAPIQFGVIKSRVLQKLLYAFERKVYRQAGQVIALSPGMVAYIAQQGLKAPVILLPNMADCLFYTLGSPPRQQFSDPFVVCYAGTIGPANHLDYLLHIARACKQALPQVQFIVAGEGKERPRLEALAQEQQLDNIRWAGTLNRQQVRQLLQQSHASYTSFAQVPVLETNSANKFFDSLAAGKLSIVNTRGWLRELVEQQQCGFYADPEQPHTFVQQLLPYLQQPALLLHAQQQARALAETKFSRQILEQRFLQLFGK